MDLCNTFDCILDDLLIDKLPAYVFDEKTLLYIYLYLENRKQGIKINNKDSNFQTITSGVPQGFIVGPILFIVFFNDFSFPCVMFIISPMIILSQVLSRPLITLQAISNPKVSVP